MLLVLTVGNTQDTYKVLDTSTGVIGFMDNGQLKVTENVQFHRYSSFVCRDLGLAYSKELKKVYYCGWVYSLESSLYSLDVCVDSVELVFGKLGYGDTIICSDGRVWVKGGKCGCKRDNSCDIVQFMRFMSIYG